MPLNRGVTKKEAEQAQSRILANRYQVIKKIGSGNFGTAFLVKDLNPGKTEELKVLKEIPVGDLPADETVDAVREANLLSKLSHPNIVKFCDSFLDGEYFCLVTEYCESGDLDQQITALKKKGKRLDEATVLQYLIQLIMAVDYMHRRRVLHRDLKARNIFLKGNMIKIGDFGISRILMGTTDQASTFVGTPYYMSPEVLHHDGYNSKSDVWSIGCILFELCAKKHAFEGQGLMGVMYKIVEGKPPRLPEEYSDDLQGILDKIFVKDPAQRISAAELLKLPIVERHIEMMRISMSLQYKDLKDCSSSILRKEADEICEMLSQKATIHSLGGGGEEGDSEKTLTPKEQMTLRKMQQADERGRQLAELTGRNYMDNQEMTRLRKARTFVSSDMLPLKSRHAPPHIAISPLDPTRGLFYNPNGTLTPAHGPAVEDEGQATPAPSYLMRTNTLGARVRPQATLVPSYRSTAYDERPITPMKDTNIYDLKYSDMDFKDALLTDGKMAETYYSQYEHEFEDLDEEEEDADENGSEADRGLQDDTVADFYSYLHMALQADTTADKTKTFGEDPIKGVFGPSVKEVKIRNLRKECIERLGEEAFQQVYDFLKRKRTMEKQENETALMNELHEISNNMTDCFLVDQLLFLETD